MNSIKELEERFESLSPEERDAFLNILSNSSQSDAEILNTLLKADYDEIPVSIDEFIESNDYAGQFTGEGNLIYPYWREQLRHIFDPTKHYQEVALTGCVSGDTIISLINGESIAIEDLSERYRLNPALFDSQNICTYSYDFTKGCFVISKILKAFCTGEKQIFRIQLSNDTFIDLTSNHRVLLSNLDWSSIDEGLSVGASLLPFSENREPIYITDIFPIYIGPVYDLEIENTHNFALMNQHIVLHNSIGIGKSTIAVVGLAYLLYGLMCLKDPASYYKLARGSTIVVAFFNNTLNLSESVGFGSLQNLILASPWFMDRGKISGTKHKEYIPDKNIRFTVGSKSGHVLGQNVFCLSGDTIIATENGNVKISDLDGKCIKVFSYNIDENKVELSEPALISHTKDTDEIYEIELDDGTIIRCTENHKFLLQSGKYESVQNLKVYGYLNLSRIIRISKVKLDAKIPVYDVINAYPHNNFLVKTNDSFIVSHNCGMIDEISFAAGANVVLEKSKVMMTYNGCIIYSTQILTDKGYKQIGDLVNESYIRVYQKDPSSNEVILSDKCTVKQTRLVTELLELQLEDDTIIKCTPDHKFLLTDGTYKEAQYLTETDDIADSCIESIA